jgi:hypothetical protein
VFFHNHILLLVLPSEGGLVHLLHRILPAVLVVSRQVYSGKVSSAHHPHVSEVAEVQPFKLELFLACALMCLLGQILADLLVVLPVLFEAGLGAVGDRLADRAEQRTLQLVLAARTLAHFI